MTTTDKQLVSIGPFVGGIDNKSPETKLKTDAKGNIISARALVNVDLDNSGTPTTRQGRTKVFSGTRCHSGYASRNFPGRFVVDNNALTWLSRAWAPTVLRAGLAPTLRLSYCEINGEIYWSNGKQGGKVTADIQDAPFGLQRPTGFPDLTPMADIGGLDAGDYQVACTFVTMTGEESGSTLAGKVSVSQNGAIQVDVIPQPIGDNRIVFARVYVTPANGDVLYQAADIAVGMRSFLLGAGPRGKALETQFASPMPPGQIVREHNGRMWVADNNFVRWSVPLHYGQTRVTSDYSQEPARITMMEPVGTADLSGVFVSSANQIWFLRGSPSLTKPMPRVRAHDFGAVFGASQRVPAFWFDPQLTGDAVFFMDTQGVALIGLPDGTLRPVAKQYLGPTADHGCVLWREFNGTRQMIANMHGANNKSRAGDFTRVTIERNGIVA